MRMNKEAFNKYCAEVMGITFKSAMDTSGSYWPSEYNPYDDLNQRMPVFDKLYQQPNKPFTPPNKSLVMPFLKAIYIEGIDKATKDFIESTIDKDNENN